MTGEWVSYTFECQACQNLNNVGVKAGACEDQAIVTPLPTEPLIRTCTRDRNCLLGEICQSGKCFDPCTVTMCRYPLKCFKGKCYV